jgi:hypothetical protein
LARGYHYRPRIIDAKPSMIVREIYAKTTLSRSKVFDYVVNPYIGCLRWTPSLGQDRGYIKIGSRYPQGVCC